MLNNKSTGSPFEEEIYSGDGYCLIYTLDGQEDYCTGDGPHVPFGSWFQEGAGGATAGRWLRIRRESCLFRR